MAVGPLTLLGQALAGGAQDYSNRRLRDQVRQEELQDINSRRQYEERLYARQRQDALTDDERRRRERTEDVTVDVLMRAGYLSPAQARDSAAVAAASQQYASDRAKELEDKRTLPTRLQPEADRLGAREDELGRIETGLLARLNAPQPPPPTQQEVMNLALRLTGKPNPSREEIASFMDAAAEQIQTQRLQTWFQDQQEAKVQIPLIRAQRQDVSQNLRFLLQQGITPNRPPPSVTLAAPAVSAAAPRGNPADTFKRLLEEAAPAPAPVAPPSQYEYPAASVLGLGERLLPEEDRTVERFAQAPMNIMAAPGRAVDAASRIVGGGAQGLLTGDYRPLPQGPFESLGARIGGFFAPEINPGDYMSEERARALNLPRSSDARNPAVVFGSPY